MLLNEARLRELYAAGEITFDELSTSLDRLLKRQEIAVRPRASRASAPMTATEREAWAERIAAAPGPARKPAGQRCPTCRSELRAVSEQGVQTAWCPSCSAYVGLDPRDVAPAPGSQRGGTIVAGAYVECGPDADGDGDVDGGLFDFFG
jgi:hypothetical protein